jgi:AraC-like DNA-binding protein
MSKLPSLELKKFQEENEIDGFYTDRLINHLKSHEREINIPHKHNFYLTVLFTKGSGSHEIDFNSYEISPGSLFLLNPGQTHHWVLSDDIDGFIFFHSQAFFDLPFTKREINNFPFFYSTQNSPCIYLEENSVATFAYSFQIILDEYLLSARMKSEKIHSLVHLIYIDAARQYLITEQAFTSGVHHYTQRIKQLEHLIEQHYLEDKSAFTYAERMHVSTKHLNRITKETLNKTTSALITERVILEAKRLLVHADSSLSEIARQLGYADYAYFSRLFKKSCGESPSQFQSKYQ